MLQHPILSLSYLQTLTRLTYHCLQQHSWVEALVQAQLGTHSRTSDYRSAVGSLWHGAATGVEMSSSVATAKSGTCDEGATPEWS